MGKLLYFDFPVLCSNERLGQAFYRQGDGWQKIYLVIIKKSQNPGLYGVSDFFSPFFESVIYFIHR